MTYDFFLKYYDISEYELRGLYIKDNKLYMDVVMPIRLELIANGYRPEMSMDQEKTFVFEITAQDEAFDVKALPRFESDHVGIGNKEYKITGNTVTVLE